MLKRIIYIALISVISYSMKTQQVEEWEILFDGADASQSATNNIYPTQVRVFDNKHFGFVDGRRSWGGYSRSLTLFDSSLNNQFKALQFPDSARIIIQDWNYVSDQIIYVLADSCKIRLFDGLNTFYSYKSFILKTIDGGKNWANIQINESWRTNPSSCLSMYNSLNGIITQYPTQDEKTDILWLTNDGWQTKEQINLNSQMNAINNAKYFEPSVIIAKNINSIVFYSTDNGVNWMVYPIPKELFFGSISYDNFYILDKNNIFILSTTNSEQTGINRSIIAKST